ncbi:hypothetical protein GUJ93_ZPchr0012g20770 [Zizania palustris]|uniref:Uncharacterized protein n=1 Tax=Zizania palustris TaxID=103762 RepID=A0A8J5WVQ3_ZIZPA|nr:hypothetical protein GUJ93_ZPchr0012g20770 [Zizania palustris]
MAATPQIPSSLSASVSSAQNPSSPPPPPPMGMGKRARHGGSGFEARLGRLISDAGLFGSSAEDVAVTLRSRFPEFRRQKLDPFTSAVRRALSSLPSLAACDSNTDDDDSHASTPSRRRRRRRLHDAHATSSSSTSLSDDGRPTAASAGI